MFTFPPKTARGCPCCRVTETTITHATLSSGLWKSFVTIQLHQPSDPRSVQPENITTTTAAAEQQQQTFTLIDEVERISDSLKTLEVLADSLGLICLCCPCCPILVRVILTMREQTATRPIS